MKTKIFCIAMSLCLMATLCACSVEDGKIRDDSEAHSSAEPRRATENTNPETGRSYDSGNTSDHHGSTAMNKDRAANDNTNNQGVTDGSGDDRSLINDVGNAAKNAGRDLVDGAQNFGRDVKDAVTDNSGKTTQGSSAKGGY